MNPDPHTIAEHMLEVGHGHTLSIQDWGSKKAKTPIFFLHGGPGGQSKDKHKLPFDPTTQRVIFHDQRGCGKSTPFGRWHHNNTQELAADITRIADFLGIDKFILTGGSWGSTLALYYAIQQPSRVSALVVNGVWTGSQAENDWLEKGLFQTHFPDVWERYLTTVPPAHQDDPTAYHFATITGKDAVAAKKSAEAYANLESAVLGLDDTFTPIDSTTFDPTSMFIEMRYIAKGCFLPNRFILKHASKLKMPVHIVQGRYDMVCPPNTAYTLSKLIPHAHLTWVLSGHRTEHETTTALRLIYAHLTQVTKK